MEFILAATVATIILVALLIGIHEFGHLIVAKRCGVKILKFSIGFGRQLTSYISRSGIQYIVALFPIGGYVKMLDTREGEVAAHERHLAFDHQPVWKRFLIIIAGPVANLLLAFAVFWLIFMVGLKSLMPVIPELANDSALSNAGIQPGAEIMSIDGYQTLDWADVTVRLFKRVGEAKSISVKVKQNDVITTKTVELNSVTLDPISPNPIQAIGVLLPKNTRDLPARVQQYNPILALSAAWNKVSLYCYFSMLVMKKLITGQLSIKSLSGPLGMFSLAGQALMDSIITFFLFMAILSIIIAIVNLVPFPGLDGGHVLYLLIEAVTGKPLSVAWQVLLFRFGVIFLGLLFIQIMVNDLVRLTS